MEKETSASPKPGGMSTISSEKMSTSMYFPTSSNTMQLLRFSAVNFRFVWHAAADHDLVEPCALVKKRPMRLRSALRLA
eukprot:2390323-Pyramimonas_sp.AAC.1